MDRNAIRRAETLARQNGFSISEGAYRGTSDDCMGRFYIVRPACGMRDKRGPGFPTKGAAWLAIVEHIRETDSFASRVA